MNRTDVQISAKQEGRPAPAGRMLRRPRKEWPPHCPAWVWLRPWQQVNCSVSSVDQTRCNGNTAAAGGHVQAHCLAGPFAQAPQRLTEFGTQPLRWRPSDSNFSQSPSIHLSTGDNRAGGSQPNPGSVTPPAAAWCHFPHRPPPSYAWPQHPTTCSPLAACIGAALKLPKYPFNQICCWNHWSRAGQ